MPPLSNKSKSKNKEGRQSRSRNTTPSSVVSVSASTPVNTEKTNTSYLNIPIASLLVPNYVSYDIILEEHGGTGGIPDPKLLDALLTNLQTLSTLAEERSKISEHGIRCVTTKKKDLLEEEREREQAAREAEERENLNRAIAAEEEASKARKGARVKRKKDRSSVKEDRPLTHGAHGVAKQDGSSFPSNTNISVPTSPEVQSPKIVATSSSKHKRKVGSGSSSSLSPTSQMQSPAATVPPEGVSALPRQVRSSSTSSSDTHQPLPAPSIMQHQTFGADPLNFDDPTIYHIREVTDDMTDDEKKDIYGVSSFPHDDLSSLIAGTPPDKDFSNAKPSNQVNSNTFAASIEPYIRPLVDEDIGFLKERGDRVAPFIMPPRGKKHYTDIWAEEDGAMSIDGPLNTGGSLPPNQPRGNIDQIDDETAETDQVSMGPVASRLLSLMRPERRAPVIEDNEDTNGDVYGNGESSSTANGYHTDNHTSSFRGLSSTSDNSATLPPATFMAESTTSGWKPPPPKPDRLQTDLRLLDELRHIGLIPPETTPSYDSHYDDEVAARLRLLQGELRKQSIKNGAAKSRLLVLAEERLAKQEYDTICDDLDEQVQTVYLKRNRNLSKTKKNIKRPGGAGGGSHYVAGPSAVNGTGVAKPGIGDAARDLIDRRKRWRGTISPVFEDMEKVLGPGESLFEGEQWEKLLKAEEERWEEGAE